MNKQTRLVMMKTGDGERETPQDFFDNLNDILNFSVDLCATKKNRKVKKYYSLKDNSFKKSWRGICWMNPPYGNGQQICDENCKKKSCVDRGYHNKHFVPAIRDWIERASKQAKKHDSTIVCLVPARVETKWFFLIWKKASAVVFIKGRLKFSQQKNVAPFPSCLAIFGKKTKSQMEKLSKIGQVIDLESLRKGIEK
jgi:phage N-6-adenine-methyltransferase